MSRARCHGAGPHTPRDCLSRAHKPCSVVMLSAYRAGRDKPATLPRFVPIPILIAHVSVTARKRCESGPFDPHDSSKFV